jgi:hypothetical protein
MVLLPTVVTDFRNILLPVKSTELCDDTERAAKALLAARMLSYHWHVRVVEDEDENDNVLRNEEFGFDSKSNLLTLMRALRFGARTRPPSSSLITQAKGLDFKAHLVRSLCYVFKLLDYSKTTCLDMRKQLSSILS